MRSKQKQNLEAFVRVAAFMDANPLPGPLAYAGARDALLLAIRRLREHAATQLSGRDLARGEVRWQQQLVHRLIVRHLRPIVAMARAQVGPDAEVRLPATVRMPRAKIGITRLLQECDSIIEIARPFEAILVAEGLPADFLAQCTAARDALVRSLSDRAHLVMSHIGARAGLEVELRRARLAVMRIDALVRASFDADEAVLAAWRSAKRVHLLPGAADRRSGGGARPEELSPEEVVRPTVPSSGEAEGPAVTSAPAEGSPRLWLRAA